MSVFKLRNRKEVFAWSLYDFANQPFTTIIVTFIYSAFFVKVIAENEQEGTFLWGIAIAITAIVVSLLSPILGALADRGGYRKFFLITSTWICAIFSILLYFPNVGDVYYALSFFIIANIAFEIKDEPNDKYAIGFGGRQKLTNRISVNAEYFYQLNDKRNNNVLSLGFDIQTGGHVFQLHLSNSSAMIDPEFITRTNGEWLKGDIYFGFNISRVFTLNK